MKNIAKHALSGIRLTLSKDYQASTEKIKSFPETNLDVAPIWRICKVIMARDCVDLLHEFLLLFLLN